jgi:hypothetical protein
MTPPDRDAYLELIRMWITEDATKCYTNLVAAAVPEDVEPGTRVDLDAVVSVAIKRAWIAGYDRALVEAAALLIEDGQEPPQFQLLRDRDIVL